MMPRMKRLVPLLLVVASSTATADDRATTITLGAMAGGFEAADEELGRADGVFGPRVTLAWEHPALALPATPGYRVAFALVPELHGGAFVLDERADMFIGAGLRGELKMAQREMGLLKVSARGSVYVALRGLVLGASRQSFVELAFGDYFFIGRSTRVGIEGTVMLGYADRMQDDTRSVVGGMMQAYIGWAP